jgi:FkbM family methyltransferase
VHKGAVVWDIGANVGLYTLPVARSAADGVRVVAFEPVPRNLEYLRRHLALNRLESAVRVVAAAAGDVAGTMRFTAGSGPSQGRLDPGGETEVPCIVLDAWRRTEGEPPPSLVKMDVEGGEAAVLRGAAEVFQSARPTLFLSIHGDEPRRECGALLQSWGYAITSLESGVPVERSMEWLAEAE